MDEIRDSIYYAQLARHGRKLASEHEDADVARHLREAAVRHDRKSRQLRRAEEGAGEGDKSKFALRLPFFFDAGERHTGGGNGWYQAIEQDCGATSLGWVTDGKG